MESQVSAASGPITSHVNGCKVTYCTVIEPVSSFDNTGDRTQHDLFLYCHWLIIKIGSFLSISLMMPHKWHVGKVGNKLTISCVVMWTLVQTCFDATWKPEIIRLLESFSIWFRIEGNLLSTVSVVIICRLTAGCVYRWRTHLNPPTSWREGVGWLLIYTRWQLHTAHESLIMLKDSSAPRPGFPPHTWTWSDLGSSSFTAHWVHCIQRGLTKHFIKKENKIK